MQSSVSAARRAATILALSGYDADPARIQRAQAWLAGQGYEVNIAVAAPHERFAGEDRARLATLNAILNGPQQDIVLALRGGYGLTRLLPHINWRQVAEAAASGTRFVGHSDFTAFQLALLSQTQAISYAGPMASYDFGGESINAFTAQHFCAAMARGAHYAQFSTQDSAEISAEIGEEFSTEGTLWGGNLAMLCSLIGTPWLPQIEGGILFLEDINEHPYRVERMLLQLHHAGILARQRALILGDFSGYRLTDYDQGYTFASMLAYMRSVLSLPIVTGLPFGHCPAKLTLPVGAAVKVVLNGGICKMAWDDLVPAN